PSRSSFRKVKTTGRPLESPASMIASSLETRSRRAVRAVDLCVAVRAGAIDQTHIGQRTVRHVAPGQQLRGMADLRVTLLAKDRPRGNEQLLVVGAVRRMAGEAVFPHRRMLEQERTALLSVTIVASLVDAIGLEQRLGGAAVRVVAIDAG